MDPSARRSFHIGRYHCVETLAQGPLGETFRAKVYGVAGLEKQYALKQIDAMLRVDPEVRSRLVEAARAYAALEHERIARLTEIHDEADTFFLVIELGRGIDLPRLAMHLRGRSESLPVDQAILIAVDVAEALVAAQVSQGVLHRGLCPGAISVLAEGEVRVSDFALAAAIERPGYAEDDALLPLLLYTAPERRTGAPAAPSADVWSVGAILFELCTGEPWLQARSAAELTSLRPEASRYAKVPARPGLRELLERLLADDPALRPQSAEALREALIGLLGLELGRARAGLQALVKRALGRTLTRTGSFAAVGIPSVSLPTLAADAPGPAAQSPAAPASPPTGPRTLLGVAASPPRPAPAASPPPRAWAPPRTTVAMPVVSSNSGTSEDTGPTQVTTLSGLGDPPQMELAELPPSPPSADAPADLLQADGHDVTITERSMSSIAFDEGVTAPHARMPMRGDAGEPSTHDASELDFSEGPTSVREIPEPKVAAAPPPPPAAGQPPSPGVGSPPPLPRPPSPTESQRLGPPLPVTLRTPPMPHVATVPPLTQLQPELEVAGAGNSTAFAEALTRESSTAFAEALSRESSVKVPLPSSPVVTLPSASAAPSPLPSAQAAPLPVAAPLSTAARSPAASGGGGARWILFGLIGVAVAAGVGISIGKARAPKAETPKVEAAAEATPKVEAPQVETPKVDTPKVEAQVETPKVEAKVETPKVEAKVETPKVEATVETPKVEAKVETPKAEAKVETPKVEAKVETPKVEAPRVEAPAAGQLVVATTPPGATLWLDGENRGTTPLSTAAAPGKHRVVIVQAGMKLVQKQLTADAAGASLTQTLEVARLPADVAGESGLKVRCRTLGELRIFVDGHDSGVTCPNDERISVSPGVHKVGLFSPRTGDLHEVDGEVGDDFDHSTRIYVRY